MNSAIKVQNPHSIEAAMCMRPKDVKMERGAAWIQPKKDVELDELLSGSKNGIWLAFDQIQDPHNVGAIFRTAAFFGVQGIIMGAERSAPLTGTVYDVASGGVEFVPFAVETNLRNAIESAKKSDIWVLGTSEHAPEPLKGLDKNRRWLVIVGNEEKGVRKSTLDACDEVRSISGGGEMRSLNVSVATGIVLSYFH